MNSWIRDSIFYHIYPLGFCGAEAENNFISEPVNRLTKIEAWIPHMKEIGINALYIGPLFESSSHGYDTADYYTVDRRLGTNEDFKVLCEKLHENGIKVIVDAVFNHVGRDFWAFKDVKDHRESSPYCNWFKNINFSGNTCYNDNFYYESWEGHYNLVTLNTNNGDVRNHIFDAIKKWFVDFKIDGIRLDAANCLDFNFLKELSGYCKSLSKDFFTLGEVIHGDYTRWANQDMLDSVTNYECYKGLYSSHNDKNYFEIAYSFNREFGDGGLYKNLPLYSFVDNHDVNRVASTLKNKKHLFPLYTLLFTMPGVPSIYYGSEWGIEGVKENNSDAGLRPKLNLDEVSTTSPNKALVETISSLAKIRLASDAIKYGSYKQLVVKNEQLAFARITDKECVIIAANLSEQPFSLTVDVPANGTKLINLADNSLIEIQNKKANLESIPSCSALILKVLK